jgi:hypothetical protein
MISQMFKVVAMAAGLGMAAQVQALDPRLELGLSYDVGGDKLGTALFTNGNTRSVRANEGVMFTVGVAIPNDPAKQFETVASIGYKVGGPFAENGKLTFNTVPLTLMEFYRPGSVRIGLGLTYHISPKYTQDVPGNSGSVNFSNTLGYIAQVGWAPTGRNFSVDLRYTAIRYKEDSANFNGRIINVANASKVNGDSVGVYGSYRFF